MKIVTSRFRLNRARRVMSDDAPGFCRVTPKPHSNLSEGVQKAQGSRACSCGQNDKRLMGEEPIPGRLTHSASPVRELALESACAWSRHFDKGIHARKALVWQRLPSDDQEVRDTVAIHRYLTREGQMISLCLVMNHFGLRQVCMHKGNCEPIFRSGNALSSRQITPWFTKLELRDRNCSVDHSHAKYPRFKGLRRSSHTATSSPWALTPFGWPMSNVSIAKRNNNINAKNTYFPDRGFASGNYIRRAYARNSTGRTKLPGSMPMKRRASVAGRYSPEKQIGTSVSRDAYRPGIPSPLILSQKGRGVSIAILRQV